MDPIGKLIEKYRTAAMVNRKYANECSPHGFAAGFYHQIADANEYAAEELEAAWRGSFGWAMARLVQVPGAMVWRNSWDASHPSLTMENNEVTESVDPNRYCARDEG